MSETSLFPSVTTPLVSIAPLASTASTTQALDASIRRFLRESLQQKRSNKKISTCEMTSIIFRERKRRRKKTISSVSPPLPLRFVGSSSLHVHPVDSSSHPDNQGPSSCRPQFIVLTRVCSPLADVLCKSPLHPALSSAEEGCLFLPSFLHTGTRVVRFSSTHFKVVRICALGKAHMSSIPSFRRSLSVGFQRDTVLGGLTVAVFRPFRLLSYQHVFQTDQSPAPEYLVTCSRTPSHLFPNT